MSYPGICRAERVLYLVLPLGFLFCLAYVAYGEVDSRKVYETHCKKCHGELGKPTERGKSLHAPDFTDKRWQWSRTDEQIVDTITNGKNKMPSWKSELTPEEIKAMAKWIRILGPRRK